jgi:hypothetical protein
MIVPAQIITNAVAQLRAALEPLEIKVYRRRQRALNADDLRAVLVTIAGAQGDRYAVDGSTDWRVTIRLTAIGRSVDEDDDGTADQIAADVLELAHNALMTSPTLDISGLDMNNAFSMSEDDEDVDDDISAMTALYEFQIATQGLTASAP